MRIRPMTSLDLPDVLRIENSTFPMGWVRSMFEAELEGPVSHSVVLEVDGALVGYAICRVILDEAHLMNIAVEHPYRGRGLGLRLLQHVMRDSEVLGAQYMFLEVRVTNIVARKLYSKTGFEEVGLRKNYYQDNGEDAILMTCSMSPNQEAKG